MKPKISKMDLPEQVEFILTDGTKMVVSHRGNRLEVMITNGQPLMVHPKSGNLVEIMVGDSSRLSIPFNPDELI